MLLTEEFISPATRQRKRGAKLHIVVQTPGKQIQSLVEETKKNINREMTKQQQTC